MMSSVAASGRAEAHPQIPGLRRDWARTVTALPGRTRSHERPSSSGCKPWERVRRGPTGVQEGAACRAGVRRGRGGLCLPRLCFRCSGVSFEKSRDPDRRRGARRSRSPWIERVRVREFGRAGRGEGANQPSRLAQLSLPTHPRRLDPLSGSSGNSGWQRLSWLPACWLFTLSAWFLCGLL